MFCSNCGTRISDDAAFCSNCGAPVGRDINQVSFKAAADNQVNNKKPVIIGAYCSVAVLAVCLLCVALLTRTLSADHSDTSVTASGDSDSIEEKSINVNDDNNGKEAVDSEDTIVVSDEAYIERLEAYQEYYNSVKDEDEDYEVLAAISLDEDNLPIMWLMFADKDKLERYDDRYRYFDGYAQLYEYKKNRVTLLAETYRFSAKYAYIIGSNTEFFMFLQDSDEGFGAWYDEDTQEFVEWTWTEVTVNNTDWRWSIKSIAYHANSNVYSNPEGITYYGSVPDLDFVTYSFDKAFDYSTVNAYWWDGSLAATDKERAIIFESLGQPINMNLKNSDDFCTLIEDLIEEPIYDIGMLTLKSKYENICDVEYCDMSVDIDVLFEETVNRYCEAWGCSYNEAIEQLNQEYSLHLQ